MLGVKKSSQADDVHTCDIGLSATQNNNFVGLRKELDFGVQATSTSTETEAQTYLCIPVNACTQYTNEDIWTKGIFKDPENKTFANFFSSVGNLVEAALEQNETINIFGEDFANLGTDEFINSQTSGDGLKELLNFTDLSFSKSKIISCIQRVPGSDSLIAYACMENATFEERIERSGRVAQAHILVWHFEDIIMPKAVFSAPSDVTIFCFCVVENQLYIVAGLISGQLAVWKTDALADPAGKSATENQKMNQRQKHPRKPIVTSSIDFSHKRTVSDIRVLPSGTDFRKNLRPVFNPNNSSMYLITSSGDGNIMIWDVSAAVHSAHLDNFQWRPFLQAPLKKAESGVDLGCCHLVIPKVEPPELTTTFWASTEDGEVLFGDWAHSGEERKFDYVKTLLNETRTYRPTLSFAISPFFEDIFLAVTDMAFYIWMADCPSPIFSSPTSGVPYACGSWSPTRPSVIFLGRHDGSLEVWDLSEQCQAYSSVFVVGAAAVTCLSFHPSRAGHRPSLAHGRRVTRPLHGRKGDALRDLGDSVLSLLAAGDASGIVHVLSLPRTLSTQTPGEVGVVRAMFLREREVISYVIQRREAIEKELGLADLEDRVPRGSTQDSSAGNTRNRMRK
ncbi:WD domain, G-beta repeat-containing protein [Toxoplasma gondii ARI]|uniref:WD domain, G-beta repeat-containing protein n=1 Tax=Toxoplasma gondii ARI TaxID=1074872 RepID=A0A139XU28_TOXGO|nr:WD domain, G-beta repeat-containing protein [Toxoplasma gondii ARI]